MSGGTVLSSSTLHATQSPESSIVRRQPLWPGLIRAVGGVRTVAWMGVLVWVPLHWVGLPVRRHLLTRTRSTLTLIKPVQPASRHRD